MVNPPDEPFERLQRRRGRKHRNERLLAGAVSLALVGAVLGGTLLVLGNRQHGTPGSQPGSSGSHPLGAAGMTGAAPAMPAGAFAYVKQIMVQPQGTMTIETWWAADGSGRLEHSCSNPDCTKDYGFPPSGVFEPGKFPTDDDMTGLSSDPATLQAQLIVRTAPGGRSPEPAFSPGPELAPGVTVGSLLDAIVNILEDPNGSPELKAAAFDVAAAQPGVQQRSGVDPAGRPATILEFAMDTGGPVDYSFDPTTHLLMAEGAPGQDSTYTLYDRGIVASTDAAPTGDQWLFPSAP